MDTEYKAAYVLVNKLACLIKHNHACILTGMKYGARLRAARKLAGFTQAELAEKVGNQITQAGIAYLETSDATGSEFTVQFAAACGINPEWLAMEKGRMVDGLVVHDERLIHLVQVCQGLADYDVDRLVQAGDALKELGFTKKKASD